jgi:hypothetical protein
MSGARAGLDFDGVHDALSALAGSRVSVRIVERAQPERLIAIFEGVLCEPSPEKAPSHFWPLEDGLGPRDNAAERFGLVLHGDTFDGGEARAGGTVVLITQGHTLVNVRRL